MFIEAVVLILAGDTILGQLNAQNICQEERRRTVNVTEYVLRNSTVRQYQWCMNVPPRCSFYSTRLVNDSRVVERELIEYIDVCCPGHTEDITANRCIPICPPCSNGTCVEGKCSCFPGYKGEHCDVGCGGMEWGENCKFKCACRDGNCHPETGNCVCPAGLTGDECDLPCDHGFYGLDCEHSCNCHFDTSCDPRTGQCDPIPEYYDTTPVPISFKESTTSDLDPPPIQFTSNGKLEIDKNPTTPSDTQITDTAFPLFEDEDRSKIGLMPVNNYISASNGLYVSTPGPVQVTKSKAKVNSKEVTVTAAEENFLNDDARRGNPEINTNRNDLVNSASAATAISAGIIIVAGVIVAANHFKKNKEGDKKDAAKGVSTVAVYTHSIFHTPLPEPPIFENPIFASPVEINPSGEGRIETRVVCSMNFPAHAKGKDPRDFLYDHPPSTGSYRAASIPEPPDVESGQSGAHPEPVYDEIPSGVAPTPISQPPPSYRSSLYMNTCGKTRF